MNSSFPKSRPYLKFFLFGLIVFLFSCTQEPSTLSVPDNFAGIPLAQQISGKQAAKFIERLHDDDVYADQNVIGIYGRGRHPSVIYISRFPSSGKAKKYLKKMSEEIGPGKSGFSHHVKFKADGKEIHFVVGMGQAHYFFALGSDLYWLTLPMEKSRQGLAQVLQISVEKVPAIEEIMQQQNFVK